MESLSPFLWGSCIPYNMPVYPGARRKTPIPLKWTAKLPEVFIWEVTAADLRDSFRITM